MLFVICVLICYSLLVRLHIYRIMLNYHSSSLWYKLVLMRLSSFIMGKFYIFSLLSWEMFWDDRLNIMICVSFFITLTSSHHPHRIIQTVIHTNWYKYKQTQYNIRYRPTCGRGRNNNWVYAHWYEEGSFSGKSQGIESDNSPLTVQGQTRFHVNNDLKIDEIVITRTFSKWEEQLLLKSNEWVRSRGKEVIDERLS